MVHNPTCGCPTCFPINYPERPNPHGGVPRAFSTLRTVSGYREDDFCCATACRDCGDSVFLIHHNGGYVLVDELGWPWPVHACYVKRHPRGSARRGHFGLASLRTLVAEPDKVKLCLVVRTAEVPQRGWTVLAVKIQNEMGRCFAVEQTGRHLAGVLVTINQEDGRIYLDDGTQLRILDSVKPELAGLTERWCSNPTESTRQ